MIESGLKDIAIAEKILKQFTSIGFTLECGNFAASFCSWFPSNFYTLLLLVIVGLD
jgi:hypothetical protein